MKKHPTIRPVSAALAFAAIFLFVSVPLHAGPGTFQAKPSSQVQMSVPNLPKVCSDLSVTFFMFKDPSGRVVLNGTVKNVGIADYDVPSEVRCYINMRYLPKTYVQTGYSEQAFTRPFQKLKKGESFTVKVVNQVPDFGAWLPSVNGADIARLYTLTVVKADMSNFTKTEDSNSGNNSPSAEVFYRKP